MFTRMTLLVASVVACSLASSALAQTPDSAPQQHPDSLTFRAVTVGVLHSCAITAAGGAYCWGWGRVGQLGNGDTASSPIPVRVAGGHHFVAVTAGRYHTCGLTADSSAYCWGVNTLGQIGTDSLGESCAGTKDPNKRFACSWHPRLVAGGRRFAAISAGAMHTCGVAANGEASCWGSNGGGTLGSESAPAVANVPIPVAGGLRLAALGAGLNHSCGVTVDGRVYCWGDNEDNQLGNNAMKESKSPVAVAATVTFRAVTAGGEHTCGITVDSVAYCWGKSEHGRLGIGENMYESMRGKKHQSSPAAVEGRLAFQSLSAGGAHTCGVATDGRAYCWGDNLDGRAGIGKGGWATKPDAVDGDLRYTVISAGDYHSCAITTDGAAYCWGSNSDGQLGNGTSKGTSKGKAVRVSFP
jgi:alpha-tubulin suppressor-like RCC1 family protein